MSLRDVSVMFIRFKKMLLMSMVSQQAQRFRHPDSIWVLATKAFGSYKRIDLIQSFCVIDTQ